jgi:hypothetical protein
MQILTVLLIVSATAATYCSNLPPGIDQLTGINLATFDIYAADPGFVSQQLVEFTCNDNRTWKDARNNVEYDFPDQVSQIHIMGGGQLDYDETECNTTEEVRLALSLQLGISGGPSNEPLSAAPAPTPSPGAFGFSASLSMSAAYDHIESESRDWRALSSHVDAYLYSEHPFDIRPDLFPLSEDASRLVATIENENHGVFNNQSAEVFNKFFEYFGTHAITGGSLGGLLRMHYAVEKKYSSTTTSASLSANAQASFFNFIKASGGVNASAKKVDTDFQEATSFSEFCFGGGGCPTDAASFVAWQQDVHTTPWLFGAQVTPTFTFIPNASTRAQTELAHVNYLSEQYLKHEVTPGLKRLLSILNGTAVSSTGDPSCRKRGCPSAPPTPYPTPYQAIPTPAPLGCVNECSCDGSLSSLQNETAGNIKLLETKLHSLNRTVVDELSLVVHNQTNILHIWDAFVSTKTELERSLSVTKTCACHIDRVCPSCALGIGCCCESSGSEYNSGTLTFLSPLLLS